MISFSYNDSDFQFMVFMVEEVHLMSLINKEVSDFTAKAFHNNGFITVTKEDLLGKWSVFFFYPADFTFVCPTELEDSGE